jgi:deoxyribodipyrimidine photo-lyase
MHLRRRPQSSRGSANLAAAARADTVSLERRCVVWFRNDLRLHDHPALSAAARSGLPAATCYVHDEQAAEAPGAARRWWLHGSLAALGEQIAARGGTLALRRGPAAATVAAFAAENAATEVHCSKSYTPHGRRVEAELAAALAAQGIRFVTHAGDLLFEPEQVRSQSGQPFKVFTAFWNACQRLEAIGTPLPVPALRLARPAQPGQLLESLELTPSSPNWALGLEDAWTPGEEAARSRLAAFVDGPVGAYRAERDRPDHEGSSRLSPALSFGEVSARTVWAAAAKHASEGATAFVRELGWREFARHLVWHWPKFTSESFRAEFRRFPWREDAAALRRWQRGLTGYPLVDAGMRQLWQTGWMHNRVRMVAASFLTKHLLLEWQHGAAWFWDTLVDADLANNSVGWQWVAGSGADAAPYFRIFNPVLQAQKFDPDGRYVRSWLPELTELPTRFVHDPAGAPPAVLRAAGVELGTTYPAPVIPHAAARARALSAYATARSRASGQH